LIDSPGASTEVHRPQLGAVLSPIENGDGKTMTEVLRVHLEKLRSDAIEYATISRETTDPSKRKLFARLSDHLTVLADEVQKEIDKQSSQGDS
jgi:hypothetical protein